MFLKKVILIEIFVEVDQMKKFKDYDNLVATAVLSTLLFSGSAISQTKTTYEAATASNSAATSYTNSLSCSSGSNDCIMIIQKTGAGETTIPSDYTSGSNQVILSLPSSAGGATGTIIKPFNNSTTQYGTDNIATLSVTTGSTNNQIYWTQSGYSVLTMTINGDSNLIKLHEYKGTSSRTFTQAISILGDTNDLTVFSTDGSANNIAEQLVVNIGLDNAGVTGSSVTSIVQISYDDYSDIIADVLGNANDVYVTHDNSSVTGSSSDKNTLVLKVDSVAGATGNIVNISQLGAATLTTKVTGTGNFVKVSQTVTETNRTASTINVGTENASSAVSNSNLLDITLNDSAMTLDIQGASNNVYATIDQSTSSAAAQRSAFNVDVDGDSNNIDLLESTHSSSTATTTRDLVVTGNSNWFYYNSTGNEATINADIIGDSNNIISALSSPSGNPANITYGVTGNSNNITDSLVNDTVSNYSVVGNSNGISTTVSGSSSTSNNVLYDIDANYQNIVTVIGGSSNDVDFDIDSTDSGVGSDTDLNITGTGNTLNAAMNGNTIASDFDVTGDSNAIYTSLTGASSILDVNINGSSNIVGSGTSGGTLGITGSNVSDIQLNITGNSNNVKASSAWSGSAGTVRPLDIDIYGNSNTLVVAQATDYALDIDVGSSSAVASSFDFSVSYDTSAGAYIASVGSAGTGIVDINHPGGTIRLTGS